MSESREFLYTASDGLATETPSAQSLRGSWFKIGFKGGGEKVSDLVSNDEEPKKGAIMPADNTGRTLETHAL